MRLSKSMIVAAALMSSACRIGGTAAKLEPAAIPQGVSISVATKSGTSYSGELLEVRDGGVVILLTDGKVAFIPWDATAGATTPLVTEVRTSYGSGQRPGAEVRNNLVILSHFPQGMTPEIQAKVLAAHGQSGVTEIR